MRARLLALWSELGESYWVLPSLMAVLAMVLGFVLVWIDRTAGWHPGGSLLIWSGGAAGARALLSTVGTSMVTVAGTVFSITIAALTLASQQFGPRLLRNFTSDRSNQVVLGVFVSTFLYCLVVLRTIRGANEGDFIPYIAVSIGVLLAIVSLGMLIYFIHHVSLSIQAESILAAVAEDLRERMESLAPPSPPGPGDAPATVLRPREAAGSVLAGSSGYVLAVDRDGLVRLAEEHDLIVELVRRPGDFVTGPEQMLAVWPGAALEKAEIAEALRSSVACGARRTPVQDVRYGVRQLTEIGTRALSPGINDPFTAMGCVDWLQAALEDLMARPMPSGVRLGESGRPRLIEKPVTFDEVLTLGLGPISAYGASSAMVALHLLEALSRLGERARRAEDCAAIRHEARLTLDRAERALSSPDDRAAVRARHAQVQRVVGVAQ